MRCPYCQHKDTQVIDSRAPDEGAVIRRRRRCLSCGKRFTTFERAQLLMPLIAGEHTQKKKPPEDALIDDARAT